MSEFIVGVNSVLYEDEFVAFSKKENVCRISERINKIDFTEFENKFNPKEFEKSEIYPNIWSEDKKELFEEMKGVSNELKKFYNTNKNLNIIASIY